MIEINGIEQIDRDLKRTQGRMKDLRPVFRTIAATFRKEIGQAQFDTSGRAQGRPWRRTRRGGRPLVRSGSLRRSFTDAGDQNHLERVTKTSLEWGSTHRLARLHQRSRETVRISSSGKASGFLPRREIVVLREDLEEPFVLEPIADYLFEDR